MLGKCLCGTIKFQLNIERLKIYQCHCEQCRKQTGTASSCGAAIKYEYFKWLSDTSHISTWQKDSGFTSHFCSVCGSSVPNLFKGNPFYWVPAGLIENDEIETVANLFVCEKAPWSNLDSQVNPHDKKPKIEELIGLLCDGAN